MEVVNGELYVASRSAVEVLDAQTGRVLRTSGSLALPGGRFGPLAFAERFAEWATIDPPSATVAAGSEATSTVTFDAATLTAGVYAGVVVVADAEARTETRVPFELTVTGTPAASVTPASLSVASALVGVPRYRQVFVHNTGTAPLTLRVTTSDPQVSVSGVRTVAAGERLALTVRVVPLAPVAGRLSESIRIETNAPGAPVVTIPVSGPLSFAPSVDISATPVAPVAPLRGEGTAAIAVRSAGESSFFVYGAPDPTQPAVLYALRPNERVIRAYDRRSGEPLRSLPVPPGLRDVGLFATRDTLFVMGSYISVPQPPVYLLALDAQTGRVLRTVPVLGDNPPPLTTRAFAVVGRRGLIVGLGGLGGTLYGFDTETGASAATLLPPIGQQFSVNSVAVGRGSLFVGAFDQQFNRPTWIEVDLRTGEVLSQRTNAASILAFASGRMYATSESGAVEAYSPDANVEIRRIEDLGTLLNGAEVAGWGETLPYPRTVSGSIGLGDGQLQLVFRASALPLGTYDGFAVVEVEDPSVSGTVPFAFSVVVDTPAEAPVAEATAFAVGAPSPNPSRGARALTVALPTPVRVTVSVFDVTGRLVERLGGAEMSAGVHTVALPSGLPAGVYTVRVAAGADVAVQRFVVVR